MGAKLMKTLIFFLILLPTSLLAAPINYQGKGEAVFPKTGKRYPCKEVFMQIEILPKKFKLYTGGYDCNPLKASYDMFELDIKNGKLMDKNVVVGDISKQEMNLSKYDPDDDSTFHLNLKFQSRSMDYTETWEQTGKQALQIKAKLAIKSR
jgi:hypothetical protein